MEGEVWVVMVIEVRVCIAVALGNVVLRGVGSVASKQPAEGCIPAASLLHPQYPRETPGVCEATCARCFAGTHLLAVFSVIGLEGRLGHIDMETAGVSAMHKGRHATCCS